MDPTQTGQWPHEQPQTESAHPTPHAQPQAVDPYRAQPNDVMPTPLQRGHTTRAERIRQARLRTMKTIPITLPSSGEEVIIRPMDMLELMAMESLPDTITQAIERIIALVKGSNIDGTDSEANNQMILDAVTGSGSAQVLRDSQLLMNAYALTCLVDPVCVPHESDITDPNQICLADLTSEDKSHIMDVANGRNIVASAAVARFSDQGNHVGTGSHGAAVQPTPVNVPGD